MNDSFELLLSAEVADGMRSSDSYESPVKMDKDRERESLEMRGSDGEPSSM